MAELLSDSETGSRAGEPVATERWKHRTGTLALILMGLATIGSSWCGYQSSLWDGIQTFQLADSAALSRDANEKAIVATQQRAQDAAFFVEYARDISQGNTYLANFFLYRTRQELRDAINAWAATHPLKNPGAPSTPFVMPQYQVKADKEAADLRSRAQTSHKEAQQANVTSDTYTLLTVLQSTALFLAGLVSTIDERRARILTLSLGLLVFFLATAVVLHLPVARPG